MMLKTVYGSPPEDEERIEAAELETESGIRGRIINEFVCTTGNLKCRMYYRAIRPNSILGAENCG
jgi:hypothetical protein